MASSLRLDIYPQRCLGYWPISLSGHQDVYRSSLGQKKRKKSFFDFKPLYDLPPPDRGNETLFTLLLENNPKENKEHTMEERREIS